MAQSAPGFEKYPDYSIDLADEPRRVEVHFAGHIVAQSEAAVRLTESRHHPVLYVPLADVDPAAIEPSATSTYCPFKGHARYWHLKVGDATVEDALWNYPEPYTEMLAIAPYVAFYTDRIDEIRLDGEIVDLASAGWVE